MRLLGRIVGFVVLVLIAAGVVLADDRAPKAVVVLVIDQMRADYVNKFGHQWSRGLRRLLTEGAWFSQAQYPYFFTVTCSGHSSISTGSLPSAHGMIQNEWWDPRAQAEVKCADDDRVKPVTYGRAVAAFGESNARLRTSTLADELRVQLSPPGRTIAFSLKARSAVTLAGSRPDAVTWFSDDGAWLTSTAYSAMPVPAVADFVGRHPVEGDLGKQWDRTLAADAYLYEPAAVGARPSAGMTGMFPHTLAGKSVAADKQFYVQWQASPYSDRYLAQMALDVATRLHFEQGSTNFIGISFSALDKVGHDFGPNSHEVQEILIGLDRTLGDLLDGLDRLFGTDNYTLALTSDHGVAPIPERSAAEGLDAGRVSEEEISAVVDHALERTLHIAGAVANVAHAQISLRPGLFERMRATPAAFAAVREAVRAMPGVLDVYPRDEMASPRPGDAVGQLLSRSYYSERTADLVLVLKPYWMAETDATTHGTAYGFDARVPLILMGKGIAPGEYRDPVTPLDIAPTLAFLTGVTLPRADGRVLIEALQAPAVTGAEPLRRSRARSTPRQRVEAPDRTTRMPWALPAL